MQKVNQIAKTIGLCVLLSAYIAASSKKETNHNELIDKGPAVLWNPVPDIRSRDLYFGPGGKENAPRGPYVFIKEDLEGTNPKFDIRDGNGTVWKVKLGLEARPETVASRLIWAAGYFASENYYLPSLHVDNLPHHLHRGERFVASDGTVTDARLKRYPDHMKKIGTWRWKDNPFVDTREFNGLRVMMALMNNWDLKDINNAIYRREDPDDSAAAEDLYIVGDLGASFGSGHWSRSLSDAKGSLERFSSSQFISRSRSDSLDFNLASRPALKHAIALPLYTQYLGMDWIGKKIPRSDARWIGQILAQLSPGQIRDAFRAADYSTEEAEGFTGIILDRIAELNEL